MASTLLNESGLWSPDAIARALAHGDSDKVRAAYHRGAHWKERLKMAQWWSDYLDGLRKDAQSRTPSTRHEGIQYSCARPDREYELLRSEEHTSEHQSLMRNSYV